MTTTLGAGMAAWTAPDGPLRLPLRHPAQQAGFTLELQTDGDVITAASMGVGFMHRGAEKLFESRDYRQTMMLANRHEWLSAIHSEVLIALALEQAMGITPPPRATWTRMLLMEANRIAVTLAFVAPVIDSPCATTAFGLREEWIAAQEHATGARVHPMFTRIGGVASALSRECLAVFQRAVENTRSQWPQIHQALQNYAAHLTGLAVLSPDDAVSYGVSGAPAHASGVAVDLRRQQPYLAYHELAAMLPDVAALSPEGDAHTRYRALALQVPASLDMLTTCIDRLDAMLDEPFDVPLPKTVRAPEGTTSMSIDGPLGIMGCLVVSDGDRMPYRLRLRTASYNNAQAMQGALRGTPLDRLADAVMSFPFVVGDIDR